MTSKSARGPNLLLRYTCPGKPVACNFELISMNDGLLLGLVAHYFGLLGCQG